MCCPSHAHLHLCSAAISVGANRRKGPPVLTPNSVVRTTVRSVALIAVAASLAACGSDEPASPEELLGGKTLPAAVPARGVGVGDAGACHQVAALGSSTEERDHFLLCGAGNPARSRLSSRLAA